MKLLLSLYPPAWRARYGAELEALVLEASGGRRVPWRMRVDVAAAAGRERLRAAGLAGAGLPPGERTRAGALLVLCAWAAFVFAGLGVQKASEHWQDAVPAASRALTAGAFDALLAAAAAGTVLVLAGVALALPCLVRFLRGGGFPLVRRRLGIAVAVTLVLAAVTAALAVWAHGLDAEQRNGGDGAYGAFFLVWVALVVLFLTAWAAAAVATARRLELPAAILRLESRLAAGVAAAMAAVTAAACVWWGAAYAAVPLEPQLLFSTALMLGATLAAGLGARASLRG